MNPAEAERLFHQAAALPTPQQRAAFLQQACREDNELRDRVERLLAAHEANTSFLGEEPGDRVTIEVPTEGIGTTIDRYKLLQKIGEGGMGVVYMAEQVKPVVRKVALKIIKLGMDTKQVVARFEAERQALALMDHPNIAKVLDGGSTETGRPYFVMELVRGVPITEYCDKNHLSARQRLELFIPVCQAIQHAHQKGIIHRDIKPSNVLVTLHDSQPLPMVIDFGIAKATNQKLTEKTLFTNFAQMIGTPAYMSPEQAEMTRLDVDTRTDIYSLGVLLYELLTGTTPFTNQELLLAGYGGMQRIIAEQEPPRPSNRLGTMQHAQRTTVAQNRRMEPAALTRLFQGDLDWVVMKCLEKERARRYETASGLAADLQRHLRSEPVAARPPTTIYRLQKAVLRNRLAFAAGGAVALAVVLGLAVASWQAVRATRAEREQSKLREAAEQATAHEVAARQTAVTAQARTAASEQNAQQLLYAANMKLLQAAWEENNVGLVRRLLDETSRSSHRGFEWYYWQRETHRHVLSLRGHSKGVSVVVYSPNGERILTSDYDGTVRLWDAGSGRQLLQFRAVSRTVEAAAFSPDGQRIVTGGFDEGREMGRSIPAQVWDASTGKEILRIRGHPRGIVSVAFSPDGRRIATSGLGEEQYPAPGTPISMPDNGVRIWDAARGNELMVIQTTDRGFGSTLESPAFSPDGQRIATITFNGTATVWDAATGKQLVSWGVGQFGRMATVQHPLILFSPDGRRIITSGDEAAKVWDAVTGTELLSIPAKSPGITAIAVSPDGRRIATGGGADYTVRLWDATTGKELSALRGHAAGITSVAFSPDGRSLATGGVDDADTDTAARVWNVDSEREPILPWRHDPQYRLAQYSSPDGQRVVTVSTNGTLRIWEAATGKELVSIEQQKPGPIPTVLGFSPDGLRMLVRGPDASIQVRETATGRESFSVTGHGLTNRVLVAFSPNGSHLATASPAAGVLKVSEIASGQELHTLRLSTNRAELLALSPDGTRIVSAKWLGVSGDTTAGILDVANGAELVTLRGHRLTIASASFSPDGSRIATSSTDRAVKVWDATSGREVLNLLGHSKAVHSVTYSQDGRRLITAGEDPAIRIWDAATGKELLTLKCQGAAFVSRPNFFPDGTRILARFLGPTGEDVSGSSKVWDSATNEQVAQWHREDEEDRIAALKRGQGEVGSETNPESR